MHVVKRLCAAVALAFLLIALPSATITEKAFAEPRPVSYRVDLTRPESGLVGVTVEVETSSSPLLLEMRDAYGDGLAVNLASHVVNEKATDSSGQALPLHRNGNTWQVEATGAILISYHVDVSGYEAGTPYLDTLANSGQPWPYFPLLLADLAYLPGYALFMYPAEKESYQPRLELAAPEGWRQAFPWHDQPDSMEELLSNPIFAGEMNLLEQGSVIVALPASSPSSSVAGLEEYAQKTSSLLREASSLLGATQAAEEKEKPILMALLFVGDGEPMPDQRYVPQPFSRSVVLRGPSGSELLSDLNIEATARGMVYLCTAARMSFSPETLWLREGAAWYYQDLVPYLAGIWGGRAFWDNFNRHYDAYRAARESFPESPARCGPLANSNPDAAAILACGGASACATLDSELHALQPQSQEMATILRNLAESKGRASSITNDDILSALESIGARSWSVLFRDFITGSEEIPLSSFSSLNIARPESVTPPVGDTGTTTSTAGWVTLAIAVIVVFIIPFVLEPYTMRPRKPGFLERKLEEEEKDEEPS